MDAGPVPYALEEAGAPSSVCPAASQPTGRLTTPWCMAQGCRDRLCSLWSLVPLESGLADSRARTTRARAVGSEG